MFQIQLRIRTVASLFINFCKPVLSPLWFCVCVCVSSWLAGATCSPPWHQRQCPLPQVRLVCGSLCTWLEPRWCRRQQSPAQKRSAVAQTGKRLMIKHGAQRLWSQCCFCLTVWRYQHALCTSCEKLDRLGFDGSVPFSVAQIIMKVFQSSAV